MALMVRNMTKSPVRTLCIFLICGVGTNEHLQMSRLPACPDAGRQPDFCLAVLRCFDKAAGLTCFGAELLCSALPRQVGTTQLSIRFFLFT